jgi:hypothetical protein
MDSLPHGRVECPQYVEVDSSTGVTHPLFCGEYCLWTSLVLVSGKTISWLETEVVGSRLPPGLWAMLGRPKWAPVFEGTCILPRCTAAGTEWLSARVGALLFKCSLLHTLHFSQEVIAAHCLPNYSSRKIKVYLWAWASLGKVRRCEWWSPSFLISAGTGYPFPEKLLQMTSWSRLCVCLSNLCHLNVTLGHSGASFSGPISRVEINVYY